MDQEEILTGSTGRKPALRHSLSQTVLMDSLLGSQPKIFDFGAFDNRDVSHDIISSDCISEHFVTTAHGAFAVIGNSRYGWGDPYGTDGASQYYDRQFFDAIFGEDILDIGRANQDSKHDNIGYINQEAMRWVYYELNLFGDPLATLPPQVNEYEPTITDPSISTLTGDQMTEINFSIVYTDMDNNNPLYINVVINGISYPMEKYNVTDNDFTDGCIYQLLTYLQPGDYNYFFECSDYKWSISTSEFTGLHIKEATNNNSPILEFGTVDPLHGILNSTKFTYSVLYIDEDNNSPEYINVNIDSVEYPLSKVNSLDENYMDGCIYNFETKLINDGIHTYFFNCSDGYYTNTTDLQNGPIVTILKNYKMRKTINKLLLFKLYGKYAHFRK